MRIYIFCTTLVFRSTYLICEFPGASILSFHNNESMPQSSVTNKKSINTNSSGNVFFVLSICSCKSVAFFNFLHENRLEYTNRKFLLFLLFLLTQLNHIQNSSKFNINTIFQFFPYC